MTTVLNRVGRSPGAPPSLPVARAARRGAHPTAVLVAILAGAFATIALWWNDTTSLNGLGDWLTNAGRVTGLLAGYGVVVLVALMARIPPLERGVGADKLASWHARGGRYSVSLVVAHGLLITWGYAVTAHTNVVSEAGTLLSSYPDVLMASVAGLLLVGVGVVSARAARRRMRYETWYYLHFYTYLAVGLAFSHQFSTGADFVDNNAARVAWSGMYAAVGAAILWYRILVPVRQSLRHRLRVAAIQPEGPGVVSILVAGRHLDELRAQPGQFFRWRFLTRDLWCASNPYSLSAAPGPDQLRITIKNLGEHSAALARLRPGTRVYAEGPYGAMTAARRRRQKVLLIAGGIGITPLRALFETLPGAPGDVTLLYRASSDADLVFRDELTAIAEQRGARLRFITGHRRELGHDPLSTQALTATVADLRHHDVYVCGPDAMANSTVAALREANVRRRQITTSPSRSEPRPLRKRATLMRRVIFVVFGTIAGLVGLLSFKTTATTASTPTAVSATGTTPASATGPTSSGTGASSSSTTSGSTTSASAASTSTTSSKTVTGSATDTRYGPVQVRITVTNGKLSSVTAIEYPNGNPRDQQINASAIPTLTKETIAAGNAKIDMVSGATYTSQGYLSSLQSALNEAGL